MNDTVCRYYETRGGELLVGGLRIGELAEKYGTPLFVYDRAVLDRKWALLRYAVPADFSVYYSVKANPNLTLLQYFLARGCGLEVASAGELYQALQAGCSAEAIVFAGPGKTERELEYALHSGVGEVHVESLVEAERISRLSRRLGRAAPIALRVNPSEGPMSGALRMGGRAAPFGIDEEMLDEVLDRVCGNEDLDVRGVHLYVATQVLDPVVLAEQYRKGIALARRVADRLDRPLRTVDFGGGLGVPYFAGERELDLHTLKSALAALMADIRRDDRFASTQFIVEPGRFLVAEAGIYVTRVTDMKESRGKRFVILDGGMHQHLAASGNLGQTIKRNFPLVLLEKMHRVPEHPVDVVGPLCTPLDMLGRNVMLPDVAIGDLVGVLQSGAYARSASPLGFLSREAPPEIWVDGGGHYVIRRRGEHADYLRDQSNMPSEKTA